MGAVGAQSSVHLMHVALSQTLQLTVGVFASSQATQLPALAVARGCRRSQ